MYVGVPAYAAYWSGACAPRQAVRQHECSGLIRLPLQGQIVGRVFSYGALRTYLCCAQLTWHALEGSDSAVVIAALEVWNALAEEELAIIEGDSTRWTLLKIMEQAAPFLLPLLLSQLLNAAEDEDDDDSWTPAMAAAICLGLCAQVSRFTITA